MCIVALVLGSPQICYKEGKLTHLVRGCEPGPLVGLPSVSCYGK